MVSEQVDTWGTLVLVLVCWETRLLALQPGPPASQQIQKPHASPYTGEEPVRPGLSWYHLWAFHYQLKNKQS